MLSVPLLFLLVCAAPVSDEGADALPYGTTSVRDARPDSPGDRAKPSADGLPPQGEAPSDNAVESATPEDDVTMQTRDGPALDEERDIAPAPPSLVVSAAVQGALVSSAALLLTVPVAAGAIGSQALDPAGAFQGSGIIGLAGVALLLGIGVSGVFAAAAYGATFDLILDGIDARHDGWWTSALASIAMYVVACASSAIGMFFVWQSVTSASREAKGPTTGHWVAMGLAGALPAAIVAVTPAMWARIMGRPDTDTKTPDEGESS